MPCGICADGVGLKGIELRSGPRMALAQSGDSATFRSPLWNRRRVSPSLRKPRTQCVLFWRAAPDDDEHYVCAVAL